MKVVIIGVFFRSIGFIFAVILVVTVAAYWTVSAPGTIQQMIAHSSPADERAVQTEQVVLAHVQQSRAVTILYLNPGDIGDNFYRLRYALYPIQFVPYWSWTRPNQGGKVWTIPEFTTKSGLRATLLKYHVNYVLAENGPKILEYLHRTRTNNYLFRVQLSLLKKGDFLSQSLVEVTQWR